MPGPIIAPAPQDTLEGTNRLASPQPASPQGGKCPESLVGAGQGSHYSLNGQLVMPLAGQSIEQVPQPAFIKTQPALLRRRVRPIREGERILSADPTFDTLFQDQPDIVFPVA